MNYTSQIAKVLGVEVGEIFKLKNTTNNTVSPNIYRFTDKRLEVKDVIWMPSSFLTQVVLGDLEIVKIPKETKEFSKVLVGAIRCEDDSIDIMINNSANAFDLATAVGGVLKNYCKHLIKAGMSKEVAYTTILAFADVACKEVTNLSLNDLDKFIKKEKGSL